MDEFRFDALTRSLSPPSRRSILSAAVALITALVTTNADDAALAKRKRGKHANRRDRRLDGEAVHAAGKRKRKGRKKG